MQAASATLGLESLTAMDFPSLEVEWPPASDGTFLAHLHTPIEATFPVQGVPLYLEHSPFFTESVALEFDHGRALVRLHSFRVTGLRPACGDVRLGDASRGEVPLVELPVRVVHVGDGLWLHAARDSPVTVRLTSTEPDDTLFVVGRRDGWTQVARDSMHGWMRTDPRRERAPSGYGSGAGGFARRRARRPRPPDLTSCYVGPALFRERAAIRISADESAPPWATITSPESLVVRDCGDAYVEVVHLLGRWGHFGWVDAGEVARLGVLQCEDTLLVQHPVTRRIFVGISTNGSLLEGDEVTRIGSRPVVGPPFDTVTFWLLTDVCDGWRRGQRWVVRRGEGTPREVTRLGT